MGMSVNGRMFAQESHRVGDFSLAQCKTQRGRWRNQLRPGPKRTASNGSCYGQPCSAGNQFPA